MIRFLTTLTFLLTVATSADAEMIQVNATGHVTAGTDQTKIFGFTASDDLRGLPVEFTIIFDTSVGRLTKTADSEFLDGGAQFGTEYPTPIVYAGFTINHHTIKVAGQFSGSVEVESNGFIAYTVTDAPDLDPDTNVAMFGVIGRAQKVPSSLKTAYQADLLHDGGFNVFEFKTCDGAACSMYTYGNYFIEHVDVFPTPCTAPTDGDASDWAKQCLAELPSPFDP